MCQGNYVSIAKHAFQTKKYFHAYFECSNLLRYAEWGQWLEQRASECQLMKRTWFKILCYHLKFSASFACCSSSFICSPEWNLDIDSVGYICLCMTSQSLNLFLGAQGACTAPTWPSWWLCFVDWGGSWPASYGWADAASNDYLLQGTEWL